ncbi:MAG: CAP domain-containing protein, partial [Tepidiformaceae bacterium]
MHRLLRTLTGPALAAAGILVLGVVAIGGGTAAHALTNCTISDSAVALDSQETAFLGLINSYRASNGLAALTLSTNLDRSSAWMANDLGAHNYFAHNDSLGRDPS